jgi:hypothetical protein
VLRAARQAHCEDRALAWLASQGHIAAHHARELAHPFLVILRNTSFGTSMPQRGHPPHHSITSSARSRNDSGIADRQVATEEINLRQRTIYPKVDGQSVNNAFISPRHKKSKS